MKPTGKKIKLSIKAFIVVAVFFMAVAGHVPITTAQSLGSFTATGDMTTGRAHFSLTLLANGTVLVAGGDGLASAEVYNPATGTFTVVGSMSTVRAGHTATLLKDGKVLIAGGADLGYVGVPTAELYDPATSTFTAVGNMKTGRSEHVATLLSDVPWQI
jgi:hypothetical protein